MSWDMFPFVRGLDKLGSDRVKFALEAKEKEESEK